MKLCNPVGVPLLSEHSDNAQEENGDEPAKNAEQEKIGSTFMMLVVYHAIKNRSNTCKSREGSTIEF